MPTPVANTYAERWIRSIRPELLDHTITWNQQQLEHLVTGNTDHHTQHRPHRFLDERPPLAASPDLDTAKVKVSKSTRCHRPINEYRNVP